jgi:hypothetical protein
MEPGCIQSANETVLSALEKKISDLFEYRRIPWLVNYIENEGFRELYLKLLIDLQKEIFHYDSELERSWTLDHQRLEVLWASMESSLQRIISVGGDVEEYLSQIRTYALNEMSMRTGFHLNNLPIRYFYYYKSCDVRLIRRLIFERCEENVLKHNLSDWLIFDWVTEVNDDICDVFEDLDTNNGNRFLHSCMNVGLDRTFNEYIDFLHYLRGKATDSDNLPVNGKQQLILNWTLEEMDRTIDELKGIIGHQKLIKISHTPALNERIN